MFGGHWSIANGGIKYLICHVTSQNHMIEKSVYEWELRRVCHHLAKFGGHRYCSSRDVFSLSRDQARLHDYMKGQVTIKIGAPQG